CCLPTARPDPYWAASPARWSQPGCSARLDHVHHVLRERLPRRTEPHHGSLTTLHPDRSLLPPLSTIPTLVPTGPQPRHHAAQVQGHRLRNTPRSCRHRRWLLGSPPLDQQDRLRRPGCGKDRFSIGLLTDHSGKKLLVVSWRWSPAGRELKSSHLP